MSIDYFAVQEYYQKYKQLNKKIAEKIRWQTQSSYALLFGMAVYSILKINDINSNRDTSDTVSDIMMAATVASFLLLNTLEEITCQNLKSKRRTLEQKLTQK